LCSFVSPIHGALFCSLAIDRQAIFRGPWTAPIGELSTAHSSAYIFAFLKGTRARITACS
jgi:hypothetical protein